MSKLLELEQLIRDRIQRVKKNIHPAHNKAYIETLEIEIETLSWALDEILALSRQGNPEPTIPP